MGTKDIDNILNDLDSFLEESPAIPQQNLEEIVEHYIKDQKKQRFSTIFNMIIIFIGAFFALRNPVDIYHGVLHTIIVITLAYFYYNHLKTKKMIQLQDKTVSLEEFSSHRRKINLSVVADFIFFRKVFYPLMLISIVISFITFNQHYGTIPTIIEILIKVGVTVFVYRTTEITIKKYTKLAQS